MPGRIAILATATLALAAGAGTGIAADRLLKTSEPEAAPEVTETTVLLPIDELVVNLKGTGGGRLVQVEAEVQASTAVAEVCRRRMPAIRDALLSVLSEYTWAELDGAEGKSRVKHEMAAIVNGIVAPRAVDRVFLTSIVVQ